MTKSQQLIRDEILHFSISLVTGITIGSIHHNYLLSVAPALLGGFFIDADHLFDYFKFYGWKFNLKKFFEGEHFVISRKTYVPLHAWEWVPILLIVAFLVKNTYPDLFIVIISFAFSLFFHIITDVYTNDIPAELYSMIFRATHGFPSRDSYMEKKE